MVSQVTQVSHVTERRRLQTHHATGGWLITAIECGGGVVRVDGSSGVADVLVADAGPGSAFDPDCFAAAACTPDGDVLVISRQSPPALLVTPDAKRTTPLDSLGRELVHLEDQEELLLLSAALFEAMPEVLARTLNTDPTELLAAEPAALLSRIFAEVGAGSGVIIRRNPDAHDTGGHR